MVKNLPAMQETRVLIPGWGRAPGEGNGNPLQYSCLENATEEPGGHSPWGDKEEDTTEQLTLSPLHTEKIPFPVTQPCSYMLRAPERTPQKPELYGD